ncbi:MAG: SLBB domain-containing protein [candidate division WOR-3 bacterium]|nr:SLBB domain-containing protein [candidate division WOR-3 bacterium]
MKRLLFILLIPVIVFSAEIPDIYDYSPVSGDRIDVYLVDQTTLKSYSYSTYIEYDNSLIIKILDLERKSPMMNKDAESSNKSEYIPWKMISAKDMTLRDISKKINEIYADEYNVDTVFVTMGGFGMMNNIAVSIGTGKTNYQTFYWGKTFRYYINAVEARVLATELNDIYVIHKDSKEFDMVDLDEIVMPQDQIFLYPSLVNVGGSVNMPGIFPYAPGFTPMDYIGMAGGIAPYGSFSKVNLYDKDGRKVSRDREIEPGYSITVGKSFMGIAQDVSMIVSILLGIYSVFSITTSLL